MTQQFQRLLRVAIVEQSVQLVCLRSLRQVPQFEVVSFELGRDALRASIPAPVWIVSRQLDDMDGLECVEMLSQLNEESRFFVVAEEFCMDDERRCFQLPRTKYLCSRMAEHWLVRLLKSQTQISI